MPRAAAPTPDADVARFLTDGYLRIDAAIPRAIAAEARAILWNALPAHDRTAPRTWAQPVVRLGMYSHAPFLHAANTPVLHDAYDRLVGRDRWLPVLAMGTFPVRFPSANAPDDDGWHVDASFGHDATDFLDWRVNVTSRGRALLMLFLFSDVGEDDAPTRIRAGSHRDVARVLAPAGERGLTLRELVASPGFVATEKRPEVLATGPAGTVYLCHPFLVHAAQLHRGTEPRFMAQPPLLPRADVTFRIAGDDLSPVEQAIRDALDGDEPRPTQDAERR